MPQDVKSCYEESFISFLAGVLYTRKSINNYEFMRLMRGFEEKYNVSLVGYDNILILICSDDKRIYLKDDFDDRLLINGNLITVKDYLYSLTTDKVREYFDIAEYNETKRNGTFSKKKFRKKIATQK